MNPVSTVLLIIGAVLLAGGVGYALALRRQGGAAIWSPRWLVAVVASSLGAVILCLTLSSPLIARL